MPTKAKVYISLVSAAGITAVACSFLDPRWSHDPMRYAVYFVLSLFAAALKLQLPGLTGTMSIGFVFVLFGISELTLPETMLMASAGVLVQCFWRAKQRPSAVQVIFSVSAVAISLMLAYQCCHLVRAHWHMDTVAVALAIATSLYFASNSLLVSGVLAMLKGEPMRTVWQQCYLFAFPYYLLGGVVAAVMAAAGRESDWKLPLLLLPVMGLAFLFYRILLARLAMRPVPVPAQQFPGMRRAS
jgi:hypothetical protein